MCWIRLAETSAIDDIAHLVESLYRSSLWEAVTIRLPDNSRIEVFPDKRINFDKMPGRFDQAPQERKCVCTQVLERLHTMGVFD